MWRIFHQHTFSVFRIHCHLKDKMIRNMHKFTIKKYEQQILSLLLLICDLNIHVLLNHKLKFQPCFNSFRQGAHYLIYATHTTADASYQIELQVLQNNVYESRHSWGKKSWPFQRDQAVTGGSAVNINPTFGVFLRTR